MKNALFILVALLGFGCSSGQLKRCPMPASENHFWCPEKVEGDFRMCHAPREVFQCVDPK